HVMEDFHDGCAFVTGSRLTGEDRKAGRRAAVRRKIAGRLAERVAGSAVREHADFEASAIHAKCSARIRRTMREVAFGLDTALADHWRSVFVQDRSELFADASRALFEIRVYVPKSQRADGPNGRASLGHGTLLGGNEHYIG